MNNYSALLASGILTAAACLSTSAYAATGPVSVVNGNYKLACKTASIHVHGILGLTNNMSQTLPLQIPVPLSCSKDPQDIENDAISQLNAQIKLNCSNRKFLAENFNCGILADEITKRIRIVNDTLVSFIPDQVDVAAINPRGINWFFNLGMLNTGHHWLSPLGQISNTETTKYIYNRADGSFFNMGLDVDPQLAPLGCLVIGTKTVSGKIHETHLGDLDPVTKDMEANFYSDISLSCAVNLAAQSVFSNIGVSIKSYHVGARQ